MQPSNSLKLQREEMNEKQTVIENSMKQISSEVKKLEIKLNAE